MVEVKLLYPAFRPLGAGHFAPENLAIDPGLVVTVLRGQSDAFAQELRQVLAVEVGVISGGGDAHEFGVRGLGGCE